MVSANARKLRAARGISILLASATGFPWSLDSACANSSRCWSIRSAIRSMIFDRTAAGVWDHLKQSTFQVNLAIQAIHIAFKTYLVYAFLAAATASLTCLASLSGTRAHTSPVDGSKLSSRVSHSTNSPLTKLLITTGCCSGNKPMLLFLAGQQEHTYSTATTQLLSPAEVSLLTEPL